MLHDIGKARIPLAILEKPGPLDENEMAVMRQHPQFGLDALGSVSGIHKEMADVVIHHHEYLDGSGYPHGLRGSEISDLVRMITIADVFAALIDRRMWDIAPVAAAALFPAYCTYADYVQRLTDAFDDDLDTPTALAALADLEKDSELPPGAKFEV